MKKNIFCSVIFILLFLTACSDKTNDDKKETQATTSQMQEDTTSVTTSDTIETGENAEATSKDEDETAEAMSEPNIIPVENETNEVPMNAQPVDENLDRQNGTFTGLEPLPLADFSNFDPNNSKKLPETKIAHAYGVAKDGQANIISVDFQKFFDEKGYNAICLDTKSDEKILYLTFDCGYENGYTAKILDTLLQKGVKAAFFCTLPQMKENPKLIARMINEGHIVGNHSNKHPSFAEITRTRMVEEIKAFDDYLRVNFGYTAPFFRFPKGEYTENALELVQSLGYKSVFWSLAYSDWDLNNQKGKAYAFETVTARIHPGAIVLLHSVSPDNAAALGDIIDWAHSQGYRFSLLMN